MTLARVRLADGTTLPTRLARGDPDGALVVLAPGAGTSLRHPSLTAPQRALAARGITVVTFDFPYRVHGRGAPDKLPVLVDAYAAVVGTVRRVHEGALFLGGRSLGGRVATHVAAADPTIAGLVLLAFPLHPPGKPDVARAAHLASIRAPLLFVQGTRDAFARFDLLEKVVGALPRATLHAIPDADHGFRVPKRTGRTPEQVQDEIADVVARWIADVRR